MQLVVNPELASKEVLATAESLRSEFVIEVTGTVLARAQAIDKADNPINILSLSVMRQPPLQ
jgi:aspartyl-tRNA synthetase